MFLKASLARFFYFYVISNRFRGLLIFKRFDELINFY